MRYELVIITKDRREIIVKFEIEGKETTKYSLPEIDKDTRNFKNKYELFRFLERFGYDMSLATDAFIRYQYNKKTVMIDVCYSEDNLFGKNNGQIDIKDEWFNYFFNQFIYLLKNSAIFLRYILSATRENGKVVYEKLEENIKEYIYNNQIKAKELIKLNLSNYKQLRDMYFLYKEFIQSKNENKHLSNPYSSSIEEDKYNQYLESLPDGDEVVKHNNLEVSIKRLNHFTLMEEDTYLNLEDRYNHSKINKKEL